MNRVQIMSKIFIGKRCEITQIRHMLYKVAPISRYHIKIFKHRLKTLIAQMFH